MSVESVMPSNHLILYRPLLLPSIFPRIRVFSSESALHIRWPKYWSFSLSISPSNEYSGLISFRMDWFDLLAVPGPLRSSIKLTVLGGREAVSIHFPRTSAVFMQWWVRNYLMFVTRVSHLVHFSVVSLASVKLQQDILAAATTFLVLLVVVGSCLFLVLKYRGLVKHWFHSPPSIPSQIEEVCVYTSTGVDESQSFLPPVTPQSGTVDKATDTEIGVKSGPCYLYPHLHSSIIHHSQKVETPRMSIDR